VCFSCLFLVIISFSSRNKSIYFLAKLVAQDKEELLGQTNKKNKNLLESNLSASSKESDFAQVAYEARLAKVMLKATADPLLSKTNKREREEEKEVDQNDDETTGVDVNKEEGEIDALAVLKAIKKKKKEERKRAKKEEVARAANSSSEQQDSETAGSSSWRAKAL
jgi:hypothetical protein